MSLILAKAQTRLDELGQTCYTCPFCISVRIISQTTFIMQHVCFNGPVFFLNGYALKGVGEYISETKAEVERKRNGQ